MLPELPRRNLLGIIAERQLPRIFLTAASPLRWSIEEWSWPAYILLLQQPAI
jgi:hypothetical protein